MERMKTTSAGFVSQSKDLQDMVGISEGKQTYERLLSMCEIYSIDRPGFDPGCNSEIRGPAKRSVSDNQLNWRGHACVLSTLATVVGI